MAVTAKLYGAVFLAAFNKEVDLLDDEIRVSLHTSAYTPDQDVHDYKNDLTNEHPATGGYTAGGVVLGTKTLTYTPATNKIMFDAADAVWPSSTITARTAVIYDNTPATDATKPLIGYQQESADISSTGGEFRVAWAAAGIMEITVA